MSATRAGVGELPRPANRRSGASRIRASAHRNTSPAAVITPTLSRARASLPSSGSIAPGAIGAPGSSLREPGAPDDPDDPGGAAGADGAGGVDVGSAMTA